MALSPEGDLRYLVVATPESEVGAGPPVQIAPSALFGAIGFAEGDMTETEPTWLPPVYVDGRRDGASAGDRSSRRSAGRGRISRGPAGRGTSRLPVERNRRHSGAGLVYRLRHAQVAGCS